jgi:hypothetical protein
MLKSHVQTLENKKDVTGLLEMMRLGAASKAAQKVLQAMAQSWFQCNSTTFSAAEAPVWIQAAQECEQKWLATDLETLLNLHNDFLQAKRVMATDPVAILAVIRDAKESKCIGYFKEAGEILKAEFQGLCRAGDTERLRTLHETSQKYGLSDSAKQVGEVLQVADRLKESQSKSRPEKEQELIKLVGEAEKLGCQKFAADARTAVIDSVTDLESLVASPDARKCLQSIHDAARSAGLEDIADKTVQAVGGNLPNDWQATRERKFSLLQKPAATNKELIARIQQLLDATYRGWGHLGKDCSTRDRHKLGNPQGASLRIEEIIHVENAGSYLNYMHCRTEIEDQVRISGVGRFLDVKTWKVSLHGVWRHPEEPVDSSLNECWLWHGTSEAGVNGITDADFDMSRAGTATGTMFGRGLYFTESSLKADEYAMADSRGFAPLLLCRVILGRVKYCDHKSPWTIAEDLEKSVKSGRFDSVLGDRQKVRGTFREFIVFDSAQVYPEYIVWYSRQPPYKET